MDGGVLAGRFRDRGNLVVEMARRDFGGLTFQGFLHRPIAQAIGRVGTSSNVVISRDQISLQLESLILAQSERWRQA